MTDRYMTLTVVLDREIREDDAESLINAIRHLRGVADVEGNVADPETYMAVTLAKRDLRERLWKALEDYGK